MKVAAFSSSFGLHGCASCRSVESVVLDCAELSQAAQSQSRAADIMPPGSCLCHVGKQYDDRSLKDLGVRLVGAAGLQQVSWSCRCCARRPPRMTSPAHMLCGLACRPRLVVRLWAGDAQFGLSPCSTRRERSRLGRPPSGRRRWNAGWCGDALLRTRFVSEIVGELSFHCLAIAHARRAHVLAVGSGMLELCRIGSYWSAIQGNHVLAQLLLSAYPSGVDVVLVLGNCHVCDR